MTPPIFPLQKSAKKPLSEAKKESRDNAHGRGLARAIGPQEPDDLPGLHFEGDIAKGVKGSVLLGNLFEFYKNIGVGIIHEPQN